MSTMSSTAQISCVLVVVALAICSATTVATPESTPAGVALNTLHASHASAAIKRRLRPTTAMETTDNSVISEERAPSFFHPAELVSSLKSFSSAIYQKFQMWSWRLRQKSSDQVFKILKLEDLVKDDTYTYTLFENPRFMRWVTFVKARNSKDPKAATLAMYTTLHKFCRDETALAKHLVAGTKTNMKPLASDLLDKQLADLKKEKTKDEIYTILGLEQTSGNPRDNPVYLRWAALVEKEHPEDPEAVSSALPEGYQKEGALVEPIKAGKNTDGMESTAAGPLKQQRSKSKELNQEGEISTPMGLKQIEENGKSLETPLILKQTEQIGNPLENQLTLKQQQPEENGKSLEPPVILQQTEKNDKPSETPLILQQTKENVKPLEKTNILPSVAGDVKKKPSKNSVVVEDSADVSKKENQAASQHVELGKPEENPLIQRDFSALYAFDKTNYLSKHYLKIEELLATIAEGKDKKSVKEFLNEATKIHDVKDIALDLQLMNILKQEKGTISMANVFKRLGLDKKAERNTLYGNQFFPRWVAFAKEKYPQTWTREIALPLRSLYEKDDHALAEAAVLAMGSEVKNVVHTAEDVQNALIWHWIETGEKVQKIFKRLKLHETKGSPLNDPLFPLWDSFAESKYLRLQQPTKANLRMLETLRDYCEKDEAKLVKLLNAGMEIESVKLIAKKLDKAMFSEWKNSKKSVQQVYVYLGLNKKGSNPIENPLLLRYAKERDSTSHGISTKAADEMLKILATQEQYQEDTAALAKFLLDEKKKPEVRFIAEALLAAQRRDWNSGFIKKRSASVYELLKLHETTDNPFDNPLFALWVDFVKEKRLADPDEVLKSVSKTLRKVYITDAAWAKLLVSEMKADDVTNKAIAKELLKAQLSAWVKKPLDEVFLLLELGKTKGNLLVKTSPLEVDGTKDNIVDETSRLETTTNNIFDKNPSLEKECNVVENPLFPLWYDFANIKHSYSADVATIDMLLTLGKIYTEDALVKEFHETEHEPTINLIVSNIALMQLRIWKDQKSEKQVFELLKLHDKKDELFQNKLFWHWVAFVKLKFPDPKVATGAMLTTLREFYKEDADWAELLAAGMKNDGSKLLATQLLEK